MVKNNYLKIHPRCHHPSAFIRRCRPQGYFTIWPFSLFSYRAVLEGCKKGDGSLKYLNQQASRFYEEATDSCERKIGVAPFADRKLQSYIDERSKEQNFSNICEANNKVTASLVCNEYCEGTEKDQLPELFEVPMKVVCIWLAVFHQIK